MKLFKVLETSYSNFDSSIRSYLSKTFDTIGEQYSNNQIFGVLFNAIKNICQNIMFYIEDALTEQNVFTATRKKSVFSLAQISGFEPYYGSAATGTVIAKLTLNSGLSNDDTVTKLYIPNNSSIKNTVTGISYIIDMPVNTYIIDISKPLINHEFKIIEGSYRTSQGAASGYSLEAYQVSSSNLIDRNYIKVYIDGEEWEEVGNLYEMSEDSKQYFIRTGFNSTFDIIFGNGTYGRQLTEGQSIQVQYLVHSGSTGNISVIDNPKFEFSSVGYDGQGNSIDINDYITLTLNNYVSGGSDEDSIRLVKNMIGYNSRSNILANENNFKLFFSRFSFIGYSNIWSEKNSMTVTANIIRDVSDKIESYQDYLSLDESDFILTDDEKNIINNVIDNSKKAFAGITVNFIDPVIRKYALICYVKTDSSYSKESIRESIRNSIGEYFMNMETNTTFIPKSDIVTKVIDDEPAIQSFDFDFVSKLAEDTFKNGYYTRYTLEYVNGTNTYKTKKVIYEEDSYPGLDSFGNIQLDTKLEIPVVGSFSYYPDKTDKSQSVNIEGVQIVFI